MAGAPVGLPALLECAVLLGIGFQLRRARILTQADGETAYRLAESLTLPAAVLHACSTCPPLGWEQWTGAMLVAVAAGSIAAFNWIYFRGAAKRQKAVLAGCAVSFAAPALALPLAQALYGAAGVAAAAPSLLSAALVASAASYLLFASAGPAFPEEYKHEDGGVYRGEWRGLRKEGFGTYAYPSGARYEGEWRANLKDGRGVYFFPKGGMYEGEWRDGQMAGVGVRTFAGGKVQAGRWRAGRLESGLEAWQCAGAVEGASEAALAARRVPVGGGEPRDALQVAIVQPVLWAAVAGLAVNALQLSLPSSVATLARILAPANTPLLLLSAGACLAPSLPSSRQAARVSDVVVASRLCLPLLVAANLVAGVAQPHPTAVAPVLIGTLAMLAPVAASALQHAHAFRLSEALAGAVAGASAAAALPATAALALAAATCGVAPVDAAAAAGWFVAPAGAATTLAAGMLLCAALTAVAASVQHQRLDPQAKVRMVYAGVGVADAQGTAPPAAGGGADAGASRAGGASEEGGGRGGGGARRRMPPGAAAAEAASGHNMVGEPRALPLGARGVCDPRGRTLRASRRGGLRPVHRHSPLAGRAVRL